MRYKKTRVALASAGLLIAIFLVCDKVLFPLPLERLKRRSAHYVFSSGGLPLGQYTSVDKFWRQPVRLKEISPRLVSAVIECEDRRFYYHPGVNPVSLLKAALDNLKAGRVVRGGSTITMQIARMIEPKERTIANKLFEIYRALQLELRFNKDALLEFYFNLAPYGGNIEGPAAAAQHYFNHSVSDLTISEAAILTSIPASPNHYRPDRYPEELKERRDVILRKLLSAGIIQSDEYQSALAEEIPRQRSERVTLAPHVCQDVISRRPDNTRMKTTIDYQTQALCARLAKQHYMRLKKKGINNLAVVVLENSSGRIRALIGSPNCEDNVHGGQVNAALAPPHPARL